MTPAGEAGPAEHLRPLLVTMKGIASLVAPTSLVTALVFYFGWTRTSTQAALMGLEDSLLGFTFQDYLLRSIDPMYWPLFAGVVAALAGLALHGALLAWLRPTFEPDGRVRLETGRRKLLVRLCGVLFALGALTLALGVVGNSVDRPSRAVSLWSPLCITLTIVVIGYSVFLLRRFVAPPALAGGAAGELSALRFVGSILTVLLLLLSLFWNVARYAEIKGIDLALLVEERLETFPDAVVYSSRRLHLPAPAEETELSQDEASAYRFRYSGLKVLFRSGGRVFLRPSDPTVSRANILLAETADLRFEFESPGNRRPAAAPKGATRAAAQPAGRMTTRAMSSRASPPWKASTSSTTAWAISWAVAPA